MRARSTKVDPMIYTVECSFTDPGSEAEWNDFYSLEKLPALISVSGFRSSQRFRALSLGCPVYLAVHSVDNLEILTGTEYRQKGGGNFARWQEHITDWHRNLYKGLELAPNVDRNSLLVLTSAGPESLSAIGLAPSALQAAALDLTPERRWLITAKRATLPTIDRLPESVKVYEPMTDQLTKGV